MLLGYKIIGSTTWSHEKSSVPRTPAPAFFGFTSEQTKLLTNQNMGIFSSTVMNNIMTEEIPNVKTMVSGPEIDNSKKCPLPNCQNMRFMHMGKLFPVCSMNCWRTLQNSSSQIQEENDFN